jgi:hypothetical protein
LGKKEKKAPQRKKEEEEEDEEERGESTRRRETRSREKRRSFEKNLLRRSRYTLVMYAPTPQYEKGKSIWGRKKKKKGVHIERKRERRRRRRSEERARGEVKHEAVRREDLLRGLRSRTLVMYAPTPPG